MIAAKATITAARRLQFVMTACTAVFLVVLVAILMAGLFNAVGFGEEIARLGGYDAVTLRFWQGWAIIGILCVHLGLWIALFWTARSLFNQIVHESAAFAGQSARRISHLLWALLAWGLLSQMLASLAVTWHFPTGTRSIGIGIGIVQLTVIFAALMAGFMSRAFSLGAELWQDHKEVV